MILFVEPVQDNVGINFLLHSSSGASVVGGDNKNRGNGANFTPHHLRLSQILVTKGLVTTFGMSTYQPLKNTGSLVYTLAVHHTS